MRHSDVKFVHIVDSVGMLLLSPGVQAVDVFGVEQEIVGVESP